MRVIGDKVLVKKHEVVNNSVLKNPYEEASETATVKVVSVGSDVKDVKVGDILLTYPKAGKRVIDPFDSNREEYFVITLNELLTICDNE